MASENAAGARHEDSGCPSLSGGDSFGGRTGVIGHTVANLSGQLAPMIVALFAFPALIRVLGVERFGFLTLAWTMVGYLSLLDLGLGRALTHFVARSQVLSSESINVLAQGILVMGGIGALGGLALAWGAPWVADRVLNVPLPLRAEATDAMYVIAFCLPLVTLTAGFRGILEGHSRFQEVNLVRCVVGALGFLAPLLVALWRPHLAWVTASLALTRLLSVFAFARLASRVTPRLKMSIRYVHFDAVEVKRLLATGGWMTVSNIVGPLLANIDRFVIAQFLSTAMVAYYVTPYELVSKTLILPAAFIAVLFPAFSSALSREPSAARALFRNAMRYSIVVLIPPTVLFVTFADVILGRWLSPAFALQSSRIMQWMAVGVLANGIAYVPFTAIQSAGRSKWTALLHLVECVSYPACLLLAVKVYGATGAAMAWAARMSVDATGLFLLARKALPGAKGSATENGSIRLLWSGLIAVIVPFALPQGPLAFGVGSALLVWWGVFAWRKGLSREERATLASGLRRAKHQVMYWRPQRGTA